jgi:hypothetical protein
MRLLLVAFLLGQASAPSARTTYLFSYFTGNGEDGLHFAASQDGLVWTPVSGGRSF